MISSGSQPDPGFFARYLPSINPVRNPARYIKPYQWIEIGPIETATGSKFGCTIKVDSENSYKAWDYYKGPRISK